ncbi:unnamed protein product [Colias eurytheme]|nr:unnamed protein product [Colias eurytheme]
MAVRERVALFIFIAMYLLINSANCLPRNLSRAQNLENKLKKSININSTEPGTRPKLRTNLKNVNTPARTMNNAKHENLCEKFNFPEIEYPTASEPNMPFHFRESAKNFPQKYNSPKVKSNKSPYPISHATKSNKNRKAGKTQNYPLRQGPENKTMVEFSSAPSYRDIGVFPEVEYPQKAKDIWQPNYWNCPPKVVKSTVESTQNKINTDYKAAHRASSQSSYTTRKGKNSKNINKVSKKVSNQANNLKHQPDATNYDFGQKELQFYDTIKPEININSENVYTATPMPQCVQKEDLIKTALYAKIYASIANKAIASIKNILKSDKSNTTTDYYSLPKKESDILEDILRYSHSNSDDYDFYSLFHNNYYATTQRTPQEFSCEVSDNITQSWINCFSPLTEKPEIIADFQQTLSTKSSSDSCNINHYSQSIILDTTSSSHLTDVINTKPDATTLSPRAFIYDDRKIYDKNNASILGQSNECDVRTLDKVAVISCINDTDSNKTHIDRSDKNTINAEHDSYFKLDDEYTTDVYPEIKENGAFVLSTAAPFKMSLDDPSWANSEIIDPYKSVSYPDELEEYYIAVG